MGEEVSIGKNSMVEKIRWLDFIDRLVAFHRINIDYRKQVYFKKRVNLF